MSLAGLSILCLLAIVAAGPTPVTTPAPPVPLTATLVESGYNFPLFVTAPRDDTHRLFVIERGGRVFLRKDGIRQREPFLDLSDQTGMGHEYGLYSLAFHPQFARNRRFFVYYVDNNAHSRLVEYRAAPGLDHVEPGSARLILAQTQPGYALHYGGMIGFGPDGYLYVGLGDGQTGHRPSTPAQDTGLLLGKMLRLDVDKGDPYAIPADNPFAGKTDARGEVYMVGLRNPWRWSFDRETGDMWIADVGEDKREEITMIPRAGQRAANLGWPMLEGSLCYRPPENCDRPGLTPPTFEYEHPEGCSVTGGYLYRGRKIPELRGTYFYADYCTGWVRSFRLGEGGKPVDHYQWNNFPKEDAVGSFGEDAEGEIYIVMSSGKIYRIERT